MRRLRLAFILLGAAALGCSLLAQPQTATWTGFVTDTHCGTNCQVTKDMTPDVDCIRRCVKEGSKYGLWSGKKVYVLDPQDKAEEFAGQNVKVTGKMEGETIRVATIEVAPKKGTKH